MLGDGHVALADLALEAFADGREDRVQQGALGQGGKAPEERGVGQWPADLLPRELGGRHGGHPLAPEALEELAHTELVEAA